MGVFHPQLLEKSLPRRKRWTPPLWQISFDLTMVPTLSVTLQRTMQPVVFYFLCVRVCVRLCAWGECHIKEEGLHGSRGGRPAEGACAKKDV